MHGPQTRWVAGLINPFGIESSGLVASLAIADHVLGVSRTESWERDGADFCGSAFERSDGKAEIHPTVGPDRLETLRFGMRSSVLFA
jgi:hypothetical protein